MAERRYRVCSRARSPSPRRPPARPRGLSPSRHPKYSPYDRRRKDKVSREAETSWRIEKRDNFDRDLSRYDPRISEYGNRDRRCWSPPRIRSPRRIDKRDEFKRDNDISRNIRLPDNEDAGKAKYKDGVNVGHSMRSYNEGSYQWDHLLDAPRKSDNLFVKDSGQPRDYNGVGGNNLTSSGGERDYYPGSRNLGPGRDGPLSVSQYSDSTKPVSQKYEREERMQSHSYTLHRGSVNDIIPISNLSGADAGHMPSISSCYLNMDTDKLGYARLMDKHHLEKRDGNQDSRYFEKKRDGFRGVGKSIGEETYSFKNEDRLLSSGGYVNGYSRYMVSSSQPRDYISMPLRSLREGFPRYSPTRDHNMPSHLIQRGIGLTSHPIGFDGYKEKMENTLPRGPGSQLDNTRSASRLYIGLPEEMQSDQLYFGRSKLGSMSTRRNDVEEDYRDPRVSRNDIFNPVIDDCFHKKPIRYDGQWDPYSFTQEFDASRSVHTRKQELDMLGTGRSRLNYGIDGYGGYGSVKKEEHHTRVDGGQWSHVEGSDILHPRGYDPSFGIFYDSPRKMSGLLNLDEPFERRLRNKHVRDDIFYEQDVGIKVSADGNGARNIYNQENLGDENDFSKSSKNPKSSRANYEETWRSSGHMAKKRPTSSKFHPNKKSARDIKRRLGPLPHKLHVSQRLVKRYKPSIKKRLARAPPKKHASLPWTKKLSSKGTTSIHDSAGGPRDREGNHSEDHLSLAKPEPPEKSEDFKQLVQNAFFKFLKQINETPTKRKKYLEQGKAGSLKCIVCGSSSDEFVETENLARHAFTSKKVGYRSQHLGLHNALCALMGWKITEELTGEWHCEVMSNAETSALTEDLIIWPPVVIIYNSTIDNKNHDERVIVSAEKLDMKLRDMGIGSILKVCNGKPANQSVMLVKFNGTLSGLQEAERYHERYLEAKHGRAQLKQLKFKNEMPTQLISEREDDFLYGHLGIAEDLDKLDFDTKKRCVLRSKKEILSIVNAPFSD